MSVKMGKIGVALFMVVSLIGLLALPGVAYTQDEDGPRGTQASVTDSDPSHYFGGSGSINLEKLTNGHDADVPPGPILPLGEEVTRDYIVTNTGDVGPTKVVVTDDDPNVSVVCPGTTLAPSQSMTCIAFGVVQVGLYANLGTATAQAV